MHPPEHYSPSYPYPQPPLAAAKGEPLRERLLSDCFAEAFWRGDLQEAWAVAFDMLRLQTPEVGTITIDCGDWQPDSQHGDEPSSLGTVTVSPLEDWAPILGATEQTGARYLNPVQVWQEECAAGRNTSPRSIEAMQQVLQRGLGVFRWVYDEGSPQAIGLMVVSRDGRGRMLAVPEPNQTEPAWPAVFARLGKWGFAEDDKRLIRWADENLGNGGEVVSWLLEADSGKLSSYIAGEPLIEEAPTPTGVTDGDWWGE